MPSRHAKARPIKAEVKEKHALAAAKKPVPKKPTKAELAAAQPVPPLAKWDPPEPKPKPVKATPRPTLDPQIALIRVISAREVSAGFTTLHVNGSRMQLPIGMPVTVHRDFLPALASAGVDFVEEEPPVE